MERRRLPHIGACPSEYKQRRLDTGNNRGFLLPYATWNELGRGEGEVLFWHMVHAESLRDAVEYRGYSLQVSYVSPQWQVSIGMAVKDKPALSPEKQIVKGWNKEETLKR